MNTLFLQTTTSDPICSEAINHIQAVVNTMASDTFPKAFVFLCLIIVIIFLFLFFFNQRTTGLFIWSGCFSVLFA